MVFLQDIEKKTSEWPHELLQHTCLSRFLTEEKYDHQQIIPISFVKHHIIEVVRNIMIVYLEHNLRGTIPKCLPSHTRLNQTNFEMYYHPLLIKEIHQLNIQELAEACKFADFLWMDDICFLLGARIAAMI
jgi:hypothetical protein